MTYVALATEDQLSEAVGQRLLASAELNVTLLFRRNGNGYPKSRMRQWCEVANHQPLFLLTDMDKATCAGELVRKWLRRHKPPRDLIFRVAVREVEAWLLADHDGMRELLGRNATSDKPRRTVRPEAATS